MLSPFNSGTIYMGSSEWQTTEKIKFWLSVQRVGKKKFMRYLSRWSGCYMYQWISIAAHCSSASWLLWYNIRQVCRVNSRFGWSCLSSNAIYYVFRRPKMCYNEFAGDFKPGIYMMVIRIHGKIYVISLFISFALYIRKFFIQMQNLFTLSERSVYQGTWHIQLCQWCCPGTVKASRHWLWSYGLVNGTNAK